MFNPNVPPANDNETAGFEPNCSLEEYNAIIEAAQAEAIDAMDHDPDYLAELEAWSTRDDCISPDRPL